MPVHDQALIRSHVEVKCWFWVLGSDEEIHQPSLMGCGSDNKARALVETITEWQAPCPSP